LFRWFRRIFKLFLDKNMRQTYINKIYCKLNEANA